MHGSPEAWALFCRKYLQSLPIVHRSSCGFCGGPLETEVEVVLINAEKLNLTRGLEAPIFPKIPSNAAACSAICASSWGSLGADSIASQRGLGRRASWQHETPMLNRTFESDWRHRVGNHLFVSDSGYIGLVPDQAKPSDSICFIQGARAPFVVRQGLRYRYQLIGECYLHGLMKGELSEFGLCPEDILLE